MVAKLGVVPVLLVDARGEAEQIGIVFHPGVGVGHGQRLGHADIDAQRAPAAAAVVDARAQAGIAVFGRNAVHRHHVDGAVLADGFAGAAADALFHIVLVEAAIARRGGAIQRIGNADRVAEQVLPGGEGGQDVTDAHGWLALSLDLGRIGMQRHHQARPRRKC
ncbi:MAG: hypothetical protein V9E86_10480 [Nitrosomonas sp.]